MQSCSDLRILNPAYLYENNNIPKFNGYNITDILSYLQYHILQSIFSSSLPHLILIIAPCLAKTNIICTISV